jgi:DNA-binding response OmpR family regulator
MAKVLVVEDDETIRNYLDLALSSHGYKTTAVRSLSEARDVLDGDRFDGIVVDASLPDGMGIGLAAEAAARGCKPVIITGNVGAINTLLARNIPYLQKPFDVSDLISALRLPS